MMPYLLILACTLMLTSSIAYPSKLGEGTVRAGGCSSSDTVAGEVCADCGESSIVSLTPDKVPSCGGAPSCDGALCCDKVTNTHMPTTIQILPMRCRVGTVGIRVETIVMQGLHSVPH